MDQQIREQGAAREAHEQQSEELATEKHILVTYVHVESLKLRHLNEYHDLRVALGHVRMTDQETEHIEERNASTRRYLELVASWLTACRKLHAALQNIHTNRLGVVPEVLKSRPAFAVESSKLSPGVLVGLSVLLALLFNLRTILLQRKEMQLTAQVLGESGDNLRLQNVIRLVEIRVALQSSIGQFQNDLTELSLSRPPVLRDDVDFQSNYARVHHQFTELAGLNGVEIEELQSRVHLS